MNGERVGEWTSSTGGHLFTYDVDWLSSDEARPLSLSMPLRPPAKPYGHQVVEAYFDNLLPDSDSLRRQMMGRLGAVSASPFDLLAEAGRDCVGAVQLLPPDEVPRDVHSIRGEPLTEGQVASHLQRVRSSAPGAQDEEDFRISLAGTQEKTALLWEGGRWMRPLGSTPTTHILKLPLVEAGMRLDLSHSLENEWLCGQLLGAYGIPIASSRLARFKDTHALVVERFDRRRMKERWIARLPQEDFCQATGTPSARKYERDGGPGIVTIMRLLLGSSRPLEDRRDFFRTQLVFWLLCAIDGHAKNFSLFLEAGGGYRLTPRYDVISAYPLLGRRQHQLPVQKLKMAMALLGKNRHYRWQEMRRDHWLETARQSGYSAQAEATITELLQQTPSVIKGVASKLPKDFPDKVSSPILEGLAKAARRLQG